MFELDIERFASARVNALSVESDNCKVGTIGEKLIHRVIKYYIDEDEANQEVKYLGSVADVYNDDGIFEIQTKSFDKLVQKLERFLPNTPVTVVYPVVAEREIVWIDPSGGELFPPRKTSRRGRETDILSELVKIKEFVLNEHLSFCIFVIAATEYRLLDGYGPDKKKRATRVNIIPTKLLKISFFRTRDDFKNLLPDILPEIFTAKDFKKATRQTDRCTWYSLNFLKSLGLISMVGKDGNAFLYNKNC